MAKPAPPRCESFNLYPRRFLMDTADMTAEQIGVYVRILFRGWLELDHPGVYPAGSLRYLSGASDAEWETAKERILACFREEGTNLVQKGLRETYESQTRRVQSASERNRAKSKARWDNRLHAAAFPQQSHGNASFLFPKNQKTNPPTPLSAAGAAVFERLVREYPHFGARSRRSEALRAWAACREKPSEEVLFGGLARCCASEDWQREGGRFVPGLQVWIRQRGWDSPQGQAVGGAETDIERIIRIADKIEREAGNA